MTIKKCNKCGKEDDFTENPIRDPCAFKIYCRIYRERILKKIDEIIDKYCDGGGDFAMFTWGEFKEEIMKLNLYEEDDEKTI